MATSVARRPAPAVESEVLAILVFLVAEVMFFAGLASAYDIVGARAPGGVWPPPSDPVLPAGPTGLATLALLASGALVVWSGRRDVARATGALTAAGALATGFVAFQVAEFARLAAGGFTLVSSAHGGFFYLIVGAHALHAVVALGVLAWAILRLREGRMSDALFRSVRLFWYFVVGLWPFLYALVYL